METLVPPILEAVANRVREWMRREVESAVVSQPEKVEKVGPEEVALIKSELADLVGRVDALAGEHVGADPVWAHRGTFWVAEEGVRHWLERRYEFSSDSEIPSDLARPVRELLGMAGDILINREFAELYGARSGWATFSGHTEYEGAIPCGQELADAGAPYRELYERFEAAHRELKTLRHELGTLEAKKLWDES